jgi:membrane protein
MRPEGVELNSEFERAREISAGVGGAEKQLQLEPRAEPKPKNTA